MEGVEMGGSAGPLTVSFCGDVAEVDDDHTLTFGRAADVVIDDNPYMHRVVGRFESRDDRWWLCNVGASIPLEVFELSTSSSAMLMPGADQALSGPDVIVRFGAGPSHYEVPARCASFERVSVSAATDTLRVAELPLTDSQQLLIIALAEPKLRDPRGPLVVPPTKVAAQRLGWPTTKFNRKLDIVCAKLTEMGFEGLKGDQAGVAGDRRRALVEHSLRTGLVDHAMLDLLDAVTTP